MKPTSTLHVSAVLHRRFSFPVGDAALCTAEGKQSSSLIADYCFNGCLDVFLRAFSGKR